MTTTRRVSRAGSDPSAKIPSARLDHLRAMCGPHGLFEHADHDVPRLDHGYTTDDNARALVVLVGHQDLAPSDLVERCSRFVVAARVRGGFHNRMSASGRWTDRRGSDDAHARALWGLGSVLRAGLDLEDVDSAFTLGADDFDSPHSRANAYAVLGAVAAMASGTPGSRSLADRAARCLPAKADVPWMWPEPRLTYANARLPEAMLAAGEALGRPQLVDTGLELLEWLVATESSPDGFSFTPVGGRGQGETEPAFDQQPIEAWAMSDACVRAFEATGSFVWLHRAVDASLWFFGRNDAGEALYDQATGAGFDGLTPAGVNANRGTESTLAALSAVTTLRRCASEAVPR